jgi:ABC-2 type transport system ATP-binding protein
MSIVKITNLTKVIKGKTILSCININIEKGQIIGIIGRNGSGKSMLFKSICGFVIPTSGKIEVLGKEIHRDVSFPEKTGFIIEYPGFLPQYSGFKNLKILADIQDKIDDNKIIQSLNDVGLDPDDKKPVKKYSLGMKQRLGIAQSIMENPDLLVLDEPTNGLDKEGVAIIHTLLKRLKENGTTILIASHNPLDIEILCDHVYEMDNGIISLQR